MPARIYCMASAKGGSGKTVLTATFSIFLAGIGKKVLMIDLDIATNGLTLLYLKEVNKNAQTIISNQKTPHGLFDQTSKGSTPDIFQIKENIDILPATYDFQIDTKINVDEFKSSLIFLITKLRGSYDYIFIDAQAGSDEFAKIAISKDISDEVIIITEYDPVSSAGVERMKALLREDLTYVRTWILINKMLPEFVETFSDFLEVVRYLAPIPWNSFVVRSYSRRKLAIDMEYGNEYTLSIIQSLKVLLGEDISQEIEQWVEDRASTIRQPIEDQYKDAEKELKGLLEQKELHEKQVTLRWFIRTFLFVAFPMVLIMTFLVSDGFGFFIEVFGKLSKTVIISVIMILGLFSIVFTMTKWIGKSAERKVEEARFTRQLSIVEDRLKKLEVLRKADLEILVKERPKQK